MKPEKRSADGKALFQPLFVQPNKDDRSSHAQRQAIGYLGLLLPPLLWVVSGWRSAQGVPGWGTLDSISLYYYSGATAILVGVLSALAVFLFTYQGYANDGQHLDRLLGKIACFAALGVAFFPTQVKSPFTAAPLWWDLWMKKVHYGSATVLFVSFIVYSLILFRRTGPNRGKLLPDKRGRNWIYRLCGWAMVGFVVWAGFSGSQDGPIFWPESLALWAFAISWLVKGKADWTLGQAGKRALYYGGRFFR